MKINLENLLSVAHRALDEIGVAHALIGAFGMSAHGFQRATNDVDFLVDGTKKREVEDRFIELGFAVYNKSDEVLQLEGLGQLDILFANRALSQGMLRQPDLPKIKDVPVLLVEDIVGLKIQAMANNKKRRLKELADIQSLAEINKKMDWAKVRKYAELFEVWSEIEEIKDQCQN